MRGHGVGRDDPRAASQLVCDAKLIVVLALLGVKAEGDEGESIASFFGHDDEAELLEGVGKVVGCAGNVTHDGAVAVLAKADELVVLANDLRGAFGEIESERGLVGAEIVDIEDKLFREVFWFPPYDPAHTGIHL